MLQILIRVFLDGLHAMRCGLARLSRRAALAGLFSLAAGAASAATGPMPPGSGGIQFACPAAQRAAIEAGMSAYLHELDIHEAWVERQRLPDDQGLVYALRLPVSERGTRGFAGSAELATGDETVLLPAADGHARAVRTVARKEIVLALLMRGRLTVLRDAECDVQALRDLAGIRQNTVAWAENLELGWPDGDRAQWSGAFWNDGTPLPGHPLHEAVNDVFLHQDRYAVGCYAATKLVMMQGILDYYHRIHPDPLALRKVEGALMRDGEPLIGVEPDRMWSFEEDFDPARNKGPGKILDIDYGIPAADIVPGDWIYFLNTDKATHRKTGYEGSNAIYLGRGKFDDYYNDNNHSYTFEEKMNEVYQWRHGVFSRSRDAAKIEPLAPGDFQRLSRRPRDGGLLLDLRVSPRLADRLG